MSIQGEIRTLYSDREQTQAVFPRTKTSAVSDENGVGLNVRLKNAAPHNLLDNSDFRNPVNQRGKTTYNALAGEYTLDRWFSTLPNTITLNNGFINVSNDYFCQRIEAKKLTGINKVTLAVASETIYSGVVDLASVAVGQDGIAYRANNLNIVLYHESENMWQFYVQALTPINIVWTALYEGEYTAETLPEYQPKGYGAELAECMRYYWQMASAYIAYGHGGDYGNMSADIVLPVEMRVNPTVSYTLGTFIINGEDKKSELNRVDVECSTKRLRFQPVTLNATYKNKPMRVSISDIRLSADL